MHLHQYRSFPFSRGLDHGLSIGCMEPDGDLRSFSAFAICPKSVRQRSCTSGRMFDQDGISPISPLLSAVPGAANGQSWPSSNDTWGFEGTISSLLGSPGHLFFPTRMSRPFYPGLPPVLSLGLTKDVLSPFRCPRRQLHFAQLQTPPRFCPLRAPR